jgi:hypothetical protein
MVLGWICDLQLSLSTNSNSGINEVITSELLSDLALASILIKAGDELKDRIRYLLANKNNSIET